MDVSYTEQDTRLKLAISTASKTIENLLGRRLSMNTHVDILSTKRNTDSGYDIYGVGESGRMFKYKSVPLYLKNYPIDTTKPFEVYFDPSEQYPEGSKLRPDEYILDPERGMLIIKRPVGDYRRALKVVYTAGYEPTVDLDGGIVETPGVPQEKSIQRDLPVDLMQAALWQAQLVYEKQYSGNINVRETRGEGSSNTTRYVNIHGVAPEVMAIIVQNRRPRHAVI